MDASDAGAGRPARSRLRESQRHDALRDGPSLLQSLWRHRLLIIVTTVLCGMTGYGWSLLQPIRYQASGRLFLTDPAETQVFSTVRRDLDMTLHTNKEVERLESVPVLTRAAEIVDTDRSPLQLRESISTESTPELGLITITATAQSPEDAGALADAVAVAYQDVVAERSEEDVRLAIEGLEESRQAGQARITELRRALEANPEDLVLSAQLEARIDELSALNTRAQELAVEAALYGSGVELYEPATLPTEPSAPKPTRNAALAAALGLAAAGSYAWWNAGRNQKILAREEPSAVLGVPMLGAIPRYREPLGGLAPGWILSRVGAAAAEAYQFLAASLELAIEDSEAATVLFTSAEPGEGKTTTVMNVAGAVRGEQNLAIVDADIRARTLSSLAGAVTHRGLTDLALSGHTLDSCSKLVRTRLHPAAEKRTALLVPAGSRSHEQASFFRTRAFRSAMDEVKDAADVVLVDCPPLLSVSDGLSVASQVDAVVLVVNRGTRVDRLVEARRRLELVGAPLFGYVFNRDSGRAAGRDYGYYTSAPQHRRHGVSRVIAGLFSRTRLAEDTLPS